MHTSTTPRAPQRPTQPPAYPGALRVTGTLTEDAQLYPTAGISGVPGMFLRLSLQPAQGLPYVARVDLGADITDHMAAEALLPSMRTGAVLSVAAQALALRTDHGHAALQLVQPHAVLVLEGAAA